MADMIVLRDFSEPCKHGYQIWHVVKDTDTTDGGNVIYPRVCPGGKKVIMQSVHICTCLMTGGDVGWPMSTSERDLHNSWCNVDREVWVEMTDG